VWQIRSGYTINYVAKEFAEIDGFFSYSYILNYRIRDENSRYGSGQKSLELSGSGITTLLKE
jgi:hypothetical protein